MNRIIRIADESELQRSIYAELLSRTQHHWAACEIFCYETSNLLFDDFSMALNQGKRTPIVILDLKSNITSVLSILNQIHQADPKCMILLLSSPQDEIGTVPDTLISKVFTLKKPFEPHILKTQIEVMLQLWNDKNHLEELESELESEENLDQLFHKILSDKEQKEHFLNAQNAFLTALTHEVQTPMNGILGMTYLLSLTQLDEHQSQYIKAIERSTRQLLSVVGDILDFSKSQTGLLSLEKTTVNLCDLMDDLLDLCAPLASEKGLNFQFILPKEIPELWEADYNRLRQMLLNLIVNAIKFTPKGLVIIGVDLVKTSDTQKIRFWVKDTGVGISETIQKQIERTIHNKSHLIQHGFQGLGLAITSALVRHMQGEFFFDSTPHKGSKFWFELPLQCMGISDRPKAHQNTLLLGIQDTYLYQSVSNHLGRLGYLTEKAENPEEFNEVLLCAMDSFNGVIADEFFFEHIIHTGEVEILDHLPAQSLLLRTRNQDSNINVPVSWTLSQPISYRDLYTLYSTAPKITPNFHVDRQEIRILIVEDHLLNRSVALRILEKCGYIPQNLKAVSNGEEAIEELKKQSYQIILMDCQMPVMDGYECTRKIRAGEAEILNQSTPIIALTSHTTHSNHKKCVESGMNAFVAKPILADRLDEAIQRTWSLYLTAQKVTQAN